MKIVSRNISRIMGSHVLQLIDVETVLVSCPLIVVN